MSFFADEAYLKIYDGEVSDPKLCKNVAIPRTAQVSNVLVSFVILELIFSHLLEAWWLLRC